MRAMKTLFKGLLKPSKLLTDKLPAEMTKTKIYQWTKGDRLGDTVEVAETQNDSKWLYFEDGTRINPSLIDDYLLEIDDPSQALNVSISRPIVTSPAVVASQPPRPSTPEPAKTVMGLMIEKMSKKNVVQVPINININVPTPSIYAMLSEGMETGDLDEEIMQVALSQLQINKLQDYVKEHISNFLNAYYDK